MERPSIEMILFQVCEFGLRKEDGSDTTHLNNTCMPISQVRIAYISNRPLVWPSS
jgi:hypothetical protein